MKRRLFNLLAALSLLLFVVVGVFWIRNVSGHIDLVQMYYVREPSQDNYRGYHFEAWSYSDTLRFRFDYTYFDPPYFQNRSTQWMHDFHVGWPTGFRIYFPSEFAKMVMDIEMPGADARHYATQNPGESGQMWILAMRTWQPIILLAVPPAVWVYRRFRARRIKQQGLCPACGYDLRATPQRCPECGRTAAESA